MAFPVDAARAVTNSTTSSTTHSLNLPASIASGNILIAVVRTPALATVTWPAGWTALDTATLDASDDQTSVGWRRADGTEGATITVTLGTARVLVGLCYRITGGVGLAIGLAVVGSASQPNSPSLTAPVASGARDYLWISLGGCDDSEALTSGPASYANATVQGSTLTGTTGCTVFGATRQLNATAEDPGAWTLGSTSIWTAWTLVVSDVAFPIRVSQLPIEALVKPNTAKVRLSQLPVEALVKPNTAKVRLSQLAVEVLIRPDTVSANFRAYIID